MFRVLGLRVLGLRVFRDPMARINPQPKRRDGSAWHVSERGMGARYCMHNSGNVRSHSGLSIVRPNILRSGPSGGNPAFETLSPQPFQNYCIG